MVDTIIYRGSFGIGYVYNQGSIYYDNTSGEIRLGNKNGSYKCFGSKIKDITTDPANPKIYIISYYDGRDDLKLDLSSASSESDIQDALDTLKKLQTETDSIYFTEGLHVKLAPKQGTVKLSINGGLVADLDPDALRAELKPELDTLARLDGEVTVDGSVKKQIKDAVDGYELTWKEY